MATTVRDLVTDAERELAVLAAGETASTEDLNLGLAALNRLVDQWAAERLMIYAQTRTQFTITSGTQNYTVGPGGDVNVARPTYVEHVNYQDTSFTNPVEFQLSALTDDAWSKVPIKTLTSARPTMFYYNASFPLGTLTLWPIPTATTLQGQLYAPEQVGEFTDLNTVVSLPPGYRRLIVKNLAVELANAFEKEPSPALVYAARSATMVVKRSNKAPMDMSIEGAALIQGRTRRFFYSIFTGN